MKKNAFLLFFILCATFCWGQGLQHTWSLSSTMTATLNLSTNVLTIKTTRASEGMPNHEGSNTLPWFSVRSSIVSVIIEDGVTNIGRNAFYGFENMTSVTIGNTVRTIGAYAFYNCRSLTSVTIPNSVTTIGNQAFYNCRSLKLITIGNSVTTIGEHAFYFCHNVTSITIPNSVTTIDDYAFDNCSSLTSVTIGNSVTSIGNRTFNSCNSLASVTIGNSVTTIGYEAFRNCSSLTSITIPNSVKTIGDEAFVICSSLASVTLGNSLTRIGHRAFLGCSITSVTIPSSVTRIDPNAFNNCKNLKDITVHWIIPLYSYYLALMPSSQASTVTLHVPAGTEHLYKAALHWKDYKIVTFNVGNEIIDFQTLKIYASNGILNITGFQPGAPLNIYSLSGQLVYQSITHVNMEIPLNKGVYIVNMNNRSEKVIVK